MKGAGRGAGSEGRPRVSPHHYPVIRTERRQNLAQSIMHYSFCHEPRRAVGARSRSALTLPLSSAPILTTPSGDNWPQWRGPDGLGISPDASYPDEWAPDKNIAWKTPVAGRGHSSPIVWGDRVFLTTSIEGGPAPDGHTAPDHLGYDFKPGYLHPDSVGADRRLHAEGARLRREDRQAALGAHRLRRRHVRQPPPQEHLRLVHDGDRWQGGLRVLRVGGLYAYDFNGKPLWKKSLGGIAQGRDGAGDVADRCSRIWSSCSAIRRWATGSFIVALEQGRAAKCGGRSERRAGAGRRRWS